MNASFSDGLVLPFGTLNAITDVPGVLVGHYSHPDVYRGTTAVMTPDASVAGVSVRGANPGTLGTDALAPTALVTRVHAIGLSGGTLFGLAAITGITSWLFDQGLGVRSRGALIPIVAGAVIYDLEIADPALHPTPDWGRAAAQAAVGGAFSRGSVGAGRGGTAGKGPGCVRTKGGLGTSSLLLPDGVVVGALAVVNSLGGVINPLNGRLYAEHGGFATPQWYGGPEPAGGETTSPLEATTLGVIATNAALTKTELTKIADLAHDGLARAIRPAHAMHDGDTIFALSVGGQDRVVPSIDAERSVFVDAVGAAGADAMVLAILDAVLQAEGIPGFPACRDVAELTPVVGDAFLTESPSASLS
jgi:L-aminopeptidase/D-esterase-like protein